MFLFSRGTSAHGSCAFPSQGPPLTCLVRRRRKFGFLGRIESFPNARKGCPVSRSARAQQESLPVSYNSGPQQGPGIRSCLGPRSNARLGPPISGRGKFHLRQLQAEGFLGRQGYSKPFCLRETKGNLKGFGAQFSWPGLHLLTRLFGSGS